MPFISFSYLIMLSTTTDTMLLNRSDESGHPHSFQILKKKSFYFWTTVLFSAVWTKCKNVFSYQQWPLHSQALCRPVFETHPALLSLLKSFRTRRYPDQFRISPIFQLRALSMFSIQASVEPTVLFERADWQPRTKFEFWIIKIPRRVEFRNSTSLMLQPRPWCFFLLPLI